MCLCAIAVVEGLPEVLSGTAGKITGLYMPVSNMWNLTFKWKKKKPVLNRTHMCKLQANLHKSLSVKVLM